MKIKVTSDSTCDLPASLLEKYDIDMVPLIVMKEEEEFLDNVTITPTDIFRHVAQGGSICTTAARSAAVYQELFSKYAGEYDGIIHITLGSGFSSSCQNALIAAQKFPNVRIVESQNLCCGQGLLVLKACELAETENDLDEIIRKLENYVPKIETSFLLDRLNATPAELRRNSYHAACCWYREHGQVKEAIAAFYTIHDYDGLLSCPLSGLLMETFAGTSFTDVARSVLFRCPAPVKARYPLSLLRLCYALFAGTAFSEYARLLEEAHQIIAATRDKDLMGDWELTAALHISEGTVKNHLKIVFQKLNIDRRSHLSKLLR